MTIGAIAEATGVSVDVLRSWEARYGFPAPSRHQGGHRRYTAADIAQINQVQRHREAGMSLKAAIERARGTTDGAELSIFAGLRRRWPDLSVLQLSKRALTALTRAIEDECLSRAGRPVLVGGFERERYFRASEARWRELARTASWSAVFADFESTGGHAGGPIEIAVPSDHPMLREWAVVWDDPTFAVCLVGVERIGHAHGPKDRRFEVLWSVDPAVVRDAVSLAMAVARSVADVRTPELDAPSAAGPDEALRTLTSLLTRTMDHLDR